MTLFHYTHKLEQSCVVWHSSITREESENLERVQKSAVKIILDEEYSEYTDGLIKLNIETLFERRKSLCKNFPKETVKHWKLKDMFPINENIPSLKPRKHEKYKVNMALTERYKTSAIPLMQRLLNESIIEEEYEETY